MEANENEKNNAKKEEADYFEALTEEKKKNKELTEELIEAKKYWKDAENCVRETEQTILKLGVA